MENFKVVIDKAITSCKNSKFNVFDHFVDFNKMIEIGKTAKRKILNYKLSKYACYLLVQTADQKKGSSCFRSNIFLLFKRGNKE